MSKAACPWCRCSVQYRSYELPGKVFWLCDSYHCDHTDKEFQSNKCAAGVLRHENKRLIARATGRAATAKRLAKAYREERTFRHSAVVHQEGLARSLRRVAELCSKVLGDFAHANPVEMVVSKIISDQQACHRMLDAAGIAAGPLPERLKASRLLT